MNDKIRLVTTKGCEACKIMNNLIRQAITKSTFTHITIEIIDCENERYRQFLNRYFVRDFPTMIFMRENQVLYKDTGTSTVNDIVKKIQYWFGK